MEKIIKEIIKTKKVCYFVSPHLDDAALSAGGLISHLARKTKVVVITAFTEAGKDKHSLSAVAYIKQCRYKKEKVQEFFEARKKEDRKLFESYTIEIIHLGLLDALWRKKRSLNIIEKFSTLFFNDFRYIYPTHRLHISKGKIFKEDEENLRKLEKKLKGIVGEGNNSVVFCPLGLGRHVDHIMAREACTNVFPRVIYWEDSPYNLYHELEKDFIRKMGLKRKDFGKNQTVRKSMYPAYKTQFGKLFNGEEFNLLSEAYHIK